MATLDIIELESMPVISGAPQIWAEPAPVTQQVTISGSTAKSAAFNAKTKFIAITSDSAFRYKVGDTTVTAAATNFRVSAGQILAFAVPPGAFIAAITTT